MAYTIADLDAIVAKLESSLAKGYAEVTHDGNRMVYRSTDEIMKALGYFKGLRNSASDATPAVDKRTFFLYGGPR